MKRMRLPISPTVRGCSPGRHLTAACLAVMISAAVSFAGQGMTLQTSICAGESPSEYNGHTPDEFPANGTDPWGVARYRVLENRRSGQQTTAVVQLIGADGALRGCARRTIVARPDAVPGRATAGGEVESEEFAIQWDGKSLLIRTNPATGTFEVERDGQWVGAATATSKRTSTSEPLVALAQDPKGLLSLAAAVQADLAKNLRIRLRE